MEYEKEKIRFYCDVGGRVVKCSNCKHRTGKATCKAFPERIPFEKIVDSDRECADGICYEPIEK